MTKWKKDIGSFGMNPPDFGGETTRIGDRIYYIGIWESADGSDKYAVELYREGRGRYENDKLIRGRSSVKLEVAQKWYKIYKKNINKYIK